MELPPKPKRKRRRYGVVLPTPDPDNPAACYLYCRASRGHQELSLPAQLKVMRAHLAAIGLTLGTAHYNGPIDNIPEQNPDPVPGVFVDQAVSAFTINLAKRPAGQRLLETLKPGDTVMCSRLDRMFRSVADFCIVSEWFIQHDIRLVVCSPSIDLGTATGRLLARNLASLAQWESERRGERIREALDQKRLRGDVAATVDRAPASIDLGSDYRPPQKEIHVEAKPGRIFIYLRVSHRESVASGLGLLAQLERARSYADAMIAANPGLKLVEVFTDPAQSAWKKNLSNRPAGAAMCSMLEPGDHVVFATLDRGFRSIRDLANTIPDWQAKGVVAHFVGEGINLSDAGGRLLATSIVQFAEYEAQLASDRNREARAVMAAQGKYVGGRNPVFWNVVRHGNYRKLTLNRDRLVEFQLLKRYRERGDKLDEALMKIELLIAKRDGRVPLPATGAHPNSILSSKLPENYERDKRGIAFPIWSRKRWYEGRKQFVEELAKWRTVAAERRRLRGC